LIAVIASQSIRESVRQLNRRNLFEVQDIDGHAPAELAAELEAGNYQYAIFDLLYFSGDVDLGLLLIRRIVETRPELTLIVVSDSLDEDSLFVEDVIKAGVPKEHIITNRQAGLRQQLLEIFLSDDILKSPAMDTAQPVANNSKGQDVSNSEEVHSEGPLSEGVPQEHPKQLERRAVAPSSRRCISVAVAGAGSGIGCTTQAMQLLLYCRAHGHHPALIEVHSAHSLQDYLGGGKAPNSDIIDETHFIIYGTDVYIGGKSAAKAREEHDILIFDYGNYSSIPDVTAYHDKDIRIIVCGMKPWQTVPLYDVFAAEDNGIHYIFNSVHPSDQDTVRHMMEELAANTHFAIWAPDYFNYCGGDKIYAPLLRTIHTHDVPPRVSASKSKFSFFRRK